jgi:hypothetical protein
MHHEPSAYGAARFAGDEDASQDRRNATIARVLKATANDTEVGTRFPLAMTCDTHVRANSPRGQLSWTVEAVEERPELSVFEDTSQGDETLQQWRLA